MDRDSLRWIEHKESLGHFGFFRPMKSGEAFFEFSGALDYHSEMTPLWVYRPLKLGKAFSEALNDYIC